MRSRVLPPVFALAALIVPATTYAATLHATKDSRCVATPLDYAIGPESHFTLPMYVTGHEAPVKSYTLNVTLRASDGGDVPDAWRFDAAGCQPAAWFDFTTVWVIDPVQVCSYLGQSLQWGPRQESVVYDAEARSLRFTLAFQYGLEMGPRDPSRAYLVGNLMVDHGRSVVGPSTGETCGGVDRGLCITVDGTWTDWNDVEEAWSVATPLVTVNASGGECTPVPARASTWGAIKGQYR